MSGRSVTDSVRRDVERILDAAACRLLAAQLDGDSVVLPSRGDRHTLNDRADDGPLLLECEDVPVSARAHRDGGRNRVA